MWLNFLAFLLFTVIASAVGEDNDTSLPSFECNQNNAACVFENVELTEPPYDWLPTAQNPDVITDISFKNSKITVVTSAICKAFPALVNLDMRESSIAELKDDAFQDCTKLSNIKFSRNSIKDLPSNAFSSNDSSLTQIYLNKNNIENIGENFFSNLTKLELIDIRFNKLKYFSPDLIQFNKNLKALSMQGNDLDDIDAEKIVENLPNLRQLDLDDNELSCMKLAEVIKFLKDKKISSALAGEKPKDRSYTPVKTGIYLCRPELSWMTAQVLKQVMWIIDNIKEHNGRLDRIEELLC